jgi:hypothetical protein
MRFADTQVRHAKFLLGRQLHRRRPLPADVGLPRPFPLPFHDQAVPDQDPIDRPRRRHRPLEWSAQQLHPDPFRTPAGERHPPVTPGRFDPVETPVYGAGLVGAVLMAWLGLRRYDS